MLELEVTPRAELDMAEIFEYTYENWGIIQADRYQDELFEGMQIILDNPEIGEAYHHQKRSYRKLHVNRHLLFYRIESQTCIIIRILHDKMDIIRHIKKD